MRNHPLNKLVFALCTVAALTACGTVSTSLPERAPASGPFVHPSARKVVLVLLENKDAKEAEKEDYAFLQLWPRKLADGDTTRLVSVHRGSARAARKRVMVRGAFTGAGPAAARRRWRRAGGAGPGGLGCAGALRAWPRCAPAR